MKDIDFNLLNGTLSTFEEEKSRIYVLRNETGEGVIKSYEILEDIDFLQSNFHMNHLITKERRDFDCLAIDYCYEGSLECNLIDGEYLYQKPGDLSLDSRTKGYEGFFFPLNHYHSFTVVFFLPQAQASIEKSFPDFPVDLRALREKFLAHSYPWFIKNHPEIRNIFESLKDIDAKNKSIYILLKILTLLLILDSMDMEDVAKREKNIYFPKANVEKIKRIQNLMVDNLEHHYTLNALSEKFKIPLTTMTSCFKEVYGKPINTYMREYKMGYAAKELLLSELSIAEVGLKVGYSNPSKFSSAFRQVLGVLPKEYRKIGKTAL